MDPLHPISRIERHITVLKRAQRQRKARGEKPDPEHRHQIDELRERARRLRKQERKS